MILTGDTMTLRETGVFIYVLMLSYACASYHHCRKNERFTVDEGERLSLTCGATTDSARMYWYWKPVDGRDYFFLGTYSFSTGESFVKHTDLKLEKATGKTTKLTIRGKLVSRINGSVKCMGYDWYDQKKSTHFCLVRVRAPQQQLTSAASTTVGEVTNATGTPNNSDRDGNDGVKDTLVGGALGGVAAVIIVVTLVVAICLWKRCESRYVVLASGTQSSIHRYSELNNSPQISRQAQRTTQNPSSMDEELYENTAFGANRVGECTEEVYENTEYVNTEFCQQGTSADDTYEIVG